MPIKILRGAVLAHGSNADHVSKTIDYMLNSSWLSVDSSGIVTLLVDPDRYL